ncbi:MAG: preprotein translocase subunit YajC [Eubacteriales bacterium]
MTNQTMIQLLPLVLLIVIMYFLLIRPQKKREKTITQMRNSLSIGDEIITIGGICGRIIKIKEEKVTIEVGTDKTKFEVMRWAISKVVNLKEEASEDKNNKSSSKKSKVKRPSDKKEALKEKTEELTTEKEPEAIEDKQEDAVEQK